MEMVVAAVQVNVLLSTLQDKREASGPSTLPYEMLVSGSASLNTTWPDWNTASLSPLFEISIIQSQPSPKTALASTLFFLFALRSGPKKDICAEAGAVLPRATPIRKRATREAFTLRIV